MEICYNYIEGDISMKIIELTELQFKNYSKLHSARSYFQTVEYAHLKGGTIYYLGFINEEDNTLMGATLLLEERIYKYRIGIIPGSFLIDYNNDNLFKDFINTLKVYLKKKKYIYITTDNIFTYKMFDKNNNIIYYDTNVIKLFDELSFIKTSKISPRNVILETEKTPDETFKLFNSNTKRNIYSSIRRAINIYMDDNIEPLLKLNNTINKKKIDNIIKYFNNDNLKAEIYYAKINPEQYINNYRFLLKEEEEKNDFYNNIMQNLNIKKSDNVISRKMDSDKKITKYKNEIIKATSLYTKYINETIIGGILIIKNNREIYFIEEGYDKELGSFYSSHLIKWEIIKKYLNEGYKIFNFGSIKNMDKKNGNYNFKMGFGGKVYEYIGTYDLIINKYLYNIAKIVVKIRKILKKNQ